MLKVELFLVEPLYVLRISPQLMIILSYMSASNNPSEILTLCLFRPGLLALLIVFAANTDTMHAIMV